MFETNSDLRQGTDNRDSIVFIHGLTGGREKTWTHEDGTFWPQDLLPNDFAKARILTFGYDADIVHIFGQASTNTLRDHGRTLCTDLTMLRLRTSSVSRGEFLSINCRHGCS
jgi:protein SERAC1